MLFVFFFFEGSPPLAASLAFSLAFCSLPRVCSFFGGSFEVTNAGLTTLFMCITLSSVPLPLPPFPTFTALTYTRSTVIKEQHRW